LILQTEIFVIITLDQDAKVGEKEEEKKTLIFLLSLTSSFQWFTEKLLRETLYLLCNATSIPATAAACRRERGREREREKPHTHLGQLKGQFVT